MIDLKPSNKILVILLFITFTGVFPLDVVLPSFPALAVHFSVPLDDVSLSLSLFVACFSIAQLVMGPLPDKFGRRKLLLAGLMMAVVGSTGAIFTENLYSFLFFRSLQALGCGCFVLVNALIQDIYKVADRHKMRILTTTASGLFISIAPLMGAMLQALGNWPASFIFFAVITTIVAIASAIWIPKSVAIQNTSLRATSGINLNALSNATFLKGSLLAAIGFSCHFAFIVQSPILLLDGLSLSQNLFALILLCYGISYLAGGAVATAIQTRVTPEIQMRIGLRMLVIAGAALTLTSYFVPNSITGILAPMIICTFGITILRPAATSAAMDASGNQAGTAASLHNAIIFTMGATISALVTLAPLAPAFSLSIAIILLGLAGLAIIRMRAA